MSASEPARLALYNRLGEVIGPDNAETLMSSLPLQPAADLATRADIADTRIEMGHLRVEIGEMRAEMRSQYRTFLILTIGSLTALTGIFSVVVGLIT